MIYFNFIKMGKIIGRLQMVGIANETEKGVGVEPIYWLSVVDKDLNPIVETKIKEGSFGRIETGYETEIVSKHNEPNFSGLVFDNSFGLLLLAALGEVESELKSGETAVYEHTFSVKNDNDHPSLTISFSDENLKKWVKYAMLSSLTIDASVDDYVRYSADFVGRFEADMEESYPGFGAVFTEENVFTSRFIEIKIADNIEGLATADPIKAQKISLGIKKNPIVIYSFGSPEPSEIHNGDFEVEGSLDVVMDLSEGQYRDFFAGNKTKAMSITLKNTDITIGNSSNPEIKIILAKIKFNPYKMDAKLGDIMKETVSFKSYYSIADTKSIEAVITNTVGSYIEE